VRGCNALARRAGQSPPGCPQGMHGRLPPGEWTTQTHRRGRSRLDCARALAHRRDVLLQEGLALDLDGARVSTWDALVKRARAG